MSELNRELQQELLKVFHYFDFFRHALSRDEVRKYLGVKLEDQDFDLNLDHLFKQEELEFENGFYSLKNRRENITERLSNLKLNKKRFKQAKFISKILKNIPFVRGVGISGSLSKNGSTPDSDIDFFLITEKNKVWTVKAIAILIKKLLFFGSHKYLCVNYLLAEDNLALKSQNQFQAIEAITIKPIYGATAFNGFYKQNQWIREYYPNKFPTSIEHLNDNNSWLKSLFQAVLNTNLGEKLEILAMREFRKHGVLKYGNKQGSKVSYKRNESVYFPNDFETIVLKNYEQRINNLISQPA
jgi:predicted nucleotidyltransferase